MRFLFLVLLPVFSVAQCRNTNPIVSIETGYQYGFTMSIEAGFWQVHKPFQASVGVMAYNVKSNVVNDGKNYTEVQPSIDPFIRAGFKFDNKGSLILVASGLASWHGIIGLTGKALYQVGPVTLAGIELGATNKGLLAKMGIVFTF